MTALQLVSVPFDVRYCPEALACDGKRAFKAAFAEVCPVPPAVRGMVPEICATGRLRELKVVSVLFDVAVMFAALPEIFPDTWLPGRLKELKVVSVLFVVAVIFAAVPEVLLASVAEEASISWPLEFVPTIVLETGTEAPFTFTTVVAVAPGPDPVTSPVKEVTASAVIAFNCAWIAEVTPETYPSSVAVVTEVVGSPLTSVTMATESAKGRFPAAAIIMAFSFVPLWNFSLFESPLSTRMSPAEDPAALFGAILSEFFTLKDPADIPSLSGYPSHEKTLYFIFTAVPVLVVV